MSMTYEEHVARAMLLNAMFYPAYHCYRIDGLPTIRGRWLDADSLEDIGDGSAVLTVRRQEWSKENRYDGTEPWHEKWFRWREWK